MTRHAQLRRERERQRQAQLEALASEVRHSCRGLPRLPWIPRTRKFPLHDTLLLLES